MKKPVTSVTTTTPIMVHSTRAMAISHAFSGDSTVGRTTTAAVIPLISAPQAETPRRTWVSAALNAIHTAKAGSCRRGSPNICNTAKPKAAPRTVPTTRKNPRSSIRPLVAWATTHTGIAAQ